MTKLIFAPRNFSNAPKNVAWYAVYILQSFRFCSSVIRNIVACSKNYIRICNVLLIIVTFVYNPNAKFYLNKRVLKCSHEANIGSSVFKMNFVWKTADRWFNVPHMTSSNEISNKSVHWSVEAHMPSISYNKFLYLTEYNLRTAVVLNEHFGQSNINLLTMMHI